LAASAFFAWYNWRRLKEKTVDTIWRILIYGAVGAFLIWLVQTIIRDAIVSAMKATVISQLEAITSELGSISSELQEINQRMESERPLEE
jgi:hypothetical protein